MEIQDYSKWYQQKVFVNKDASVDWEFKNRASYNFVLTDEKGNVIRQWISFLGRRFDG